MNKCICLLSGSIIIDKDLLQLSLGSSEVFFLHILGRFGIPNSNNNYDITDSSIEIMQSSHRKLYV